MALAELRDRRTFNELLYGTYEGISRDRLTLLSEECFDKVVRPALFPNARSLVKRCRDEGHDVVLVSGALDFVLDRLVRHLGASGLIVATGSSSRPTTRLALASAGRGGSREGAPHARARPADGHDLAHCFAYSDSYSDVPMLSVVGHPAAVNPDVRLKHLARSYGWPVLSLD